jgi:hypothetical protein
MNLPRMFKVRQRFPAGKVENVEAALRKELTGCGVFIKPGARIAIAVGSRGMANLPLIVRETVAWVKAQGGLPFIVPAMGSHGGATAEGQRHLLESYDITENNVGAPIVSSMEVAQLGPDAFMDKAAHDADGVIVINRIKPHTSFHGEYESGLMKMIAIGLGKEAGATAIHRHGVEGLRDLMPRVAQAILKSGKVLLGIATVENAYDETLKVQAIPAGEISAVEPELLTLARANMPSLPVADLDVLVVDEIGKDISGTGLDTNVIGRLRIAGEPEPTSPEIKMIVVRDLSTASGGSAYGIGLADVTTRRLVEKIDWKITNANVQASGFLERGKLPHIADTDEKAIEWALSQCSPTPPDRTRIIRIKNTLHLETMVVSEHLLEETKGRDTMEMLGPAEEFFEPLTF